MACNYSEQCQYYDTQSVCVETGPGRSQCGCSEGWRVRRREGGGGREICSAVQAGSESDQLATLLGLGLGLTSLTALLCFTFKLFSKARTVETRGYGDASQPPQLMVEGVDVSQEVENCSRTSSKSRIYTPGPPLTPSQVRRMSELSSLSVTVQEKDFTVRPVSPGASVGGSLDLLFERDEAVEHQLTIIPRVGSFKRRKSLVNHAFPELHRKPTGGSSSLVILTKTRTDGEGRRHSVAVPLLATQPQPHASQSAQAGLVIERRTGRRTGERRHSLQVPPGNTSRSRSPRRQNSARQSSRRPSRQGFYQFLEQAVAT